jgi:arsenite methyltransferase
MLQAAGFVNVLLVPKPASKEYIKDWLPGSGCEDFVVSADITATKP